MCRSFHASLPATVSAGTVLFWHPSASVILVVVVVSQPWGALARMFLELVGELIGFYLAKLSQDTVAL